VAYVTWRIDRPAVAMNDRGLKDIGLTRSEIPGALREAARDRALSRRNRTTGTMS